MLFSYKTKIGKFTDLTKWNFIAMSEENIQSLFQSLKTVDVLDQDFIFS